MFPKMTTYYLGARGRVTATSLEEIANTYRASNRDPNIRLTELADGSKLSTVLLSVDHSRGLFDKKPHKPVIFETMLFDQNGQVSDLNCTQRYTSKFEAKQGHRKIHRFLARKLGGYGKRIV